MKIIKAQPGFQEKFLSSSADIVIGGSAAGVGKTYALLMEFPRHINNPKWGGVIFRRTTPMIKNEGGLWDTSFDLYPGIGGQPLESKNTWIFPSGSKLRFAHIEYEKNKLDWQGAQVPFIGFDELPHFTESQFFYLLSRNRSMCGIRPIIRATCNPDPDSWVYRFISWWIDTETGFPIPERAGVIRYFIRDGGAYVWGDTKQEVIDKCPHLFNNPDFKSIDPNDLVKSITFIPGKITDNELLIKNNPEYLANLYALPEDEKSRLLDGNWKYVVNENDLILPEKLRDTFTNSFIKMGEPAITADIAFRGSDKFVVCVWAGFKLIHMEIHDKVDPDEVERIIKELAERYKVPRSRIVYDADGLGHYLKGYLKGAIPFHNGGKPIEVEGEKENYIHLKSQCFYKFAERINDSGYYFPDFVTQTTYGDKSIRELIESERKAIKRDKADSDGKLKLIPKEQMKSILGHSPDIMDSFMMRERLELGSFEFWVG